MIDCTLIWTILSKLQHKDTDFPIYRHTLETGYISGDILVLQKIYSFTDFLNWSVILTAFLKIIRMHIVK